MAPAWYWRLKQRIDKLCIFCFLFLLDQHLILYLPRSSVLFPTWLNIAYIDADGLMIFTWTNHKSVIFGYKWAEAAKWDIALTPQQTTFHMRNTEQRAENLRLPPWQWWIIFNYPVLISFFWLLQKTNELCSVSLQYTGPVLSTSVAFKLQSIATSDI